MKFELARKAWVLLNRGFPEALGATLMPDHLHLILPLKSEQVDRKKLSGILGTVTRISEITSLWQTLSPPAKIPDKFHLRRQLRYVALNPCRSSLCSDPLEWNWSTYRDLVGAAAQPWVDGKTLAKALGDRSDGFAVRFHAYVSGDPSVAVQGTPPPEPARPKEWAEEGIGEILLASAAALRLATSEVRKPGALRDLFIHLAWRQGWRQPSLLSQICKITVRAVQYTLKKEPPSAITAAALCLGDRRLRQGCLPLDFLYREKNQS